LVIDLDSLKVEVFTEELHHADHCRSSSYFSRNGEILEASEFHVVHRCAPGNMWPDGKSWRRRCTNATNAGLLNKDLLFYDGWLYAPGSCWFRLNPETFSEEMLVPGRLPSECSMSQFAISAHYGLIAWGSDGKGNRRIYRVAVRDASDAARSENDIPESKPKEKHSGD
jgi:hypothetical protein